eukprot:TRINITY_DN66192_c8_g5_i1.p1 TRINITY_DN66192_c8_g5~~TRINITY_DN66192_c8_g5_i1.p1  ORF type:complete len:213 (+),score=20.21 TRINITY_DN66192_c8_g5_i1:49-639(+)
MPGKGKPVAVPNLPPAPIFSAFFLAVGTGVGFLLNSIGFEGLLAGLVKEGSAGAWFGLMACALLVVNNWLGFITVKARNQYGVGHPLVYPNKEDLYNGKGGPDADRVSFICAVRGHENFHEGMAVFPLCLVALAFFANQPMTAAAFGLASAIGRVMYSYGYATGYPAARIPGFLLHAVPYQTSSGLLLLYFINNAL